MEMTDYPNGVPSWVDHSSADPAAASAFYAGLLGWHVEEGPAEAGGYRMGELGGVPVAGIGPQTQPGPAYWTMFVSVTDADATIARILAHGGTVLAGPMDVLDAGRMVVAADPAGAVFGLWQPGVHKGAGRVNEAGTWGWNQLNTTGLAAAETFYPAVFAWDANVQGEGPGAYTEWKLDGRSIAGMSAPPPGTPEGMPNYWDVWFIVEDADASLTRATELGGTVLMGAMDIEPGRFGVVADPTGAVFKLIALRAGVAT